MYEEYEKLIYDNITDYQFFHSIDDREYWNGIKSVAYDVLLEEKEYFDNVVFEPLYASLYMEFHTKNNRSNYEKKLYERRRALSVYMLLEAVENEGRHMEKILDIVWMTLEETQWALPAHGYLREGADALPNYKNPALCLYSSAVGSQLALAYYLFKDKFDEMSVNISPRIKEEVLDRVVYEYLNRDYGYTGLMPTARGTNNWTSRVNLGVIISAITLVDDKEILAKVAAKVMASTVQQISNYPDDGACDEGPAYWVACVATLAHTINCLKGLSGGAVDFTKQEKMIKVSEYFTTVYIYDSYVCNFADNGPKVNPFDSFIYDIGKIFGNERLISIVSDGYKNSREDIKYNTCHLIFNTLSRAECLLDVSGSSDIPPYKCKTENYIESIQVVTAHQSDKVKEGLFFAAKGGTTGEYHNHNDVGTFIVYKNGERFLCDAGNKTYNALSFTDRRYEFWENRSPYHNLPVINGCEQKALEYSSEYSAKNVVYETEGKTVRFALDINNCYSNREDINKWRRSFVFDREKGEIRVSEEYSLKKCESVVLTYLSAAPFTVETDGIVMTAPNGETLKIFIDTDLYDIETDEPEMDEMMSNDWENGLYHIQMSIKNPKPEGIIEYVIK